MLLGIKKKEIAHLVIIENILLGILAFHTAFLTPKCSFFYIKRTSFFTWLQELSISPARGQSKHIYQQTFQ